LNVTFPGDPEELLRMTKHGLKFISQHCYEHILSIFAC